MPAVGKQPIPSLTSVTRDLRHRESGLLTEEVRHSDPLARGGGKEEAVQNSETAIARSSGQRIPEMFADCYQWTKDSPYWYFRFLLYLG